MPTYTQTDSAPGAASAAPAPKPARPPRPWVRPAAAFLVVVVYAVLWAVFEPERLDWHGFATLATWVMTLFIQRAEHDAARALELDAGQGMAHVALARLEMFRGRFAHARTTLQTALEGASWITFCWRRCSKHSCSPSVTT